MALGEQHTKYASANMFYNASDYMDKTNRKVAASNVNIQIHNS